MECVAIGSRIEVSKPARFYPLLRICSPVEHRLMQTTASADILKEAAAALAKRKKRFKPLMLKSSSRTPGGCPGGDQGQQIGFKSTAYRGPARFWPKP